VPERKATAQPDDELARLSSREADQVNDHDRVIGTHRLGKSVVLPQQCLERRPEACDEVVHAGLLNSGELRI
jgi:hypothetical protein